ncbi:hypothetical protein [Paenibacillus solani]|nr:hypothetical protein [Paenibacillus solani]
MGVQFLSTAPSKLIVDMAVVAKGLTHRIVAAAFVGSSPIDRSILQEYT